MPPQEEAPAPGRARGPEGCSEGALPETQHNTFAAPAQYTRLPHSIIDSPAARRLSGNAFALLVEFVRVWCRATRNGTRKVNSVPFCHAGYPRQCSRRAFDKARRELEAAAFIECVSRRWGKYRWAEAELWRTPSAPSTPARGLCTKGTNVCAQKAHLQYKEKTNKPPTPSYSPAPGHARGKRNGGVVVGVSFNAVRTDK